MTTMNDLFETTQYDIPVNWEEELIEDEDEEDDVEIDLEKEDTSVVVVLKVSEEDAQNLHVPNFESPENLHVTVLYFSDYSDFLVGAIQAALRRINFSEVKVVPTGLERFSDESGQDAIVLLLDSPKLHVFRDHLKEQLISMGIDIEENAAPAAANTSRISSVA